MTQPTVIYFGPDASRSKNDPVRPKVFLRRMGRVRRARARISSVGFGGGRGFGYCVSVQAGLKSEGEGWRLQ